MPDLGLPLDGISRPRDIGEMPITLRLSMVILILGFANLVANGFSMVNRNVLSHCSDVQNGTIPMLTAATGLGAATFLGFILAGLVPLLAYLLPWFERDRFAAAMGLACATLFAVRAAAPSSPDAVGARQD